MLDGFEFQDNLAAHNDVSLITALNFDVIVTDWQADLLAEGHACAGKLVTKTPVICRFEQPRAQSAMNPHRKADDAVGEVVILRARGVHWRRTEVYPDRLVGKD